MNWCLPVIINNVILFHTDARRKQLNKRRAWKSRVIGCTKKCCAAVERFNIFNGFDIWWWVGGMGAWVGGGFFSLQLRNQIQITSHVYISRCSLNHLTFCPDVQPLSAFCPDVQPYFQLRVGMMILSSQLTNKCQKTRAGVAVTVFQFK